MHKLIFLYILLCGPFLSAQNWGQILIQKTDSLYPDSVDDWSTEQYYQCIDADSILLKHFFEYDSNVIIGLTRYYKNLKGFYIPLDYIGYFEYRTREYCTFHSSNPNISQDSIVSIVRAYPEKYLPLHPLRYDTAFVESIIEDSLIESGQRAYAFLYHYDYEDSAYLSRKYYRYINSFNLYPDYYMDFLDGFRIKTESKVPANMEIEQTRYLTLNDTSIKKNRDEFLWTFFNIRNPEVQAYIDEQNRISIAITDSFLFADSVALELAMWSEPFIPSLEDSVRWQRLSDTSLVEYLEQSQPYPYDDGMRFDTFKNAELIHFLDTLSFSVTYPPDTPHVYGYRANTAQVHLHKVCQILGDRRAYGAFEPDSLQRVVLDRFIDSMLGFGKLDTPQLISINKRSEARHLMIRLGRLGFPSYIVLLTDPPYLNWDRICHPEEIFRQITEEEIIKLVARGNYFLSIGDTVKAEDIGTEMYIYFSEEVFVEPDERRPRRPVAPAEERQRWADEYVWPLLLRMNHWYTRMN